MTTLTIPRSQFHDVYEKHITKPYTHTPSHSAKERLMNFVTYSTITIEILLAIRFIGKFIGANISSEVTQLVYSLSYPLVAPLLYIIPSFHVGPSILELSTLFSMTIYATVLWFLFEITSPTVDASEVIYHRIPSHSLRQA